MYLEAYGWVNATRVCQGRGLAAISEESDKINGDFLEAESFYPRLVFHQDVDHP